MALGTLQPTSFSSNDCGKICKDWVALRETVKSTTIMKMIDLSIDFVDVPLTLAIHFGYTKTVADRSGSCFYSGVMLGSGCTWTVTTLTADVALPVAKMFLLHSTAGIAEKFASGKCFELGEGNQDIIYVKDAMSGAFNNGLGWMQLAGGLLSGVFTIGSMVADPGPGKKTVIAMASLCSMAAFTFDFSDFWGNTLVLLDKLHNIESITLGNGTFTDGTKAVTHVRDSFEAEEPPDLWAIVGFSLLAISSCCCGCLFCCRALMKWLDECYPS